MPADLEFFFDPVCPFAWQTSRWIRRVAALRSLEVEWRFICLRIVNERRDYDSEFPPHYRSAHEQGRNLLRVCASVREEYGNRAVGDLYERFGNQLWNRTNTGEGFDGVLRALSASLAVADVLVDAGLDPRHADAACDDEWDTVLRRETELAFSRTGPDVGTPIITFGPPDGNSFFGPVISQLPDDVVALELFDAVRTLATYPTFSELKRSDRPPLDLPLLAG